MNEWREREKEIGPVSFLFFRCISKKMFVLSFPTLWGTIFKITYLFPQLPYTFSEVSALQWIPSPQRHILTVVLTLSLGEGRIIILFCGREDWGTEVGSDETTLFGGGFPISGFLLVQAVTNRLLGG